MQISSKNIFAILIGASAFLTVAAFSQQTKPYVTYQATGTSSGQTTAKAQADCGGGTVLGGGGSCRNNKGLVGISSSYPSGNLWLVVCETDRPELVIATATAICNGNNPPAKIGAEVTAMNRF
jgi:hypothetical protein